MFDEFISIEELFERVSPALNLKVREAISMGLNNITDIYIWNYLTDAKWKNGNNLMLCDMVDDILNLDLSEI